MVLILGPIVCYFATSVFQLCIGRLIVGLGLGLHLMICQVFMAESSPNKLRGQLVSTYIFGVFIGQIFAHCCALIFAYQLPLMLGLGMIPIIVQLVLIVLT